MAKIIPFPTPSEREPPEDTMSILATGMNIYDLNDCTETVHFFVDTDKPCKCGKEAWPPKDDE